MTQLELYFGINLIAVVLGLGAATIILLLGIFSLRSHFWFNILNGVDRLTIKFMLWPGAMLLLLSNLIAMNLDLAVSINLKWLLLAILLTNGSYLTFKFAGVIRKLENDGKTTFLSLPMPHQVFIFVAGSIAGLSWGLHAFILWYEIISNL